MHCWNTRNTCYCYIFLSKGSVANWLVLFPTNEMKWNSTSLFLCAENVLEGACSRTFSTPKGEMHYFISFVGELTAKPYDIFYTAFTWISYQKIVWSHVVWVWVVSGTFDFRVNFSSLICIIFKFNTNFNDFIMYFSFARGGADHTLSVLFTHLKID